MQFFSPLSRHQQMAISFAVALLVSASFVLFVQGRDVSAPAEVTAVASLSNAPGLLSTFAQTGETKVWAEHDSDKGLNITRLDADVKFTAYTACLHPDYLKSYPQYPGILSKNNACINKRMQHDILLQKLTTAEGSARLAKDKADMVEEALAYMNAHEKDESVDLSVLFLFKGIDDPAYYEKASFSPQCLIQGNEKNGPKFAGTLKPKGDSSSAFADSTPATQARKIKLLKEIEELYNQGEKLSQTGVFMFLQGNMFRLNPFRPAAIESFIGVLPESAAKRGYQINDSTLKRDDVVSSVSIKFYKAACKNPKEVFRFNLAVSWYDKGISKAVSFPPGDLNTCLTEDDKNTNLKRMKDTMIDNLKELREIQAKYEKQAVAYAASMKKLEDDDTECFNLSTANVPATTEEETKPPTAPVKSSFVPAPYKGYATAGDGETRAQGPGNANALCLYNETSGLSKSICDYYAEKRQGAKVLGVSILDSAFTDGANREQMNGPEFLRLVVKPLYGYINSHPEWNITHIAVAKDIPIRIIDTEKYFAKGNDFMAQSPSKTVFASANFLLSIQGDYANATNVSEYVFGSSITNESGCVALKPGLQSSRNLEYQKAPVGHFDPSAYANRPYASNPRFAVSFLSGYSLSDIKKMIDKAQAPVSAKTNAAWVFDLDPSISLFSEEVALASKRRIMESAGAPQSAVFAYSAKTSGRPKEYALPIIGYWGMGIYNPGYNINNDGSWIAGNPVIKSAVAPRAILESLESWNAHTLQGDTTHAGQATYYQGKIADAFAQNAFGGANYANSFSGAVGNVYEPTNAGTVHQEALFANYAAGLSFGESVLKSFRYLPNSLYSVHIAVGDPLMRAFDEPIREGRIINFGGSGIDTSFDITTTGGRKCYTQPSSCVAPDGTEVADGVGICADAARRQVCVNGVFSAQTKVCEKGCSLGSCVEEVFTPPNKLSLKKYQKYPLVVPVKTTSNKLSDIFRNPPYFTDMYYSIGSVSRSANYSQDFGWWWGKETDSSVPDPDILPGTGILFIPGEDYEVLLGGQPFSSSVAVNMRGAAPIFGIPFCGDKYTASQALREVRTIEPRCAAIANMAKWANTYPSLYWGSAVQGAIESDFKLNNFESYYLVCEPAVNFVWKPSCNAPPASGASASGNPQAQAVELLNRLKEMEKKIDKLQ